MQLEPFYQVSTEYVEYLAKCEEKKRGFTKVSFNVDASYINKKAYIGIFLEVDTVKFFTPLTHPKAHYNSKHFDRLSHAIKLENGSDYGRIMNCYMIPIPEKELTYIKINDIKDEKYKRIFLFSCSIFSIIFFNFCSKG